MIHYDEEQDRYIADDTYAIRRRVTGDHVEWQIKHISSLTWTSAGVILHMAEAIRQAQEHYAEHHADGGPEPATQ
jgi:hypothetical protein